MSLAPEPSPDVVKQQRKAARRDARRRGLRNFERQLGGIFTKNRSAAAEKLGPLYILTA